MSILNYLVNGNPYDFSSIKAVTSIPGAPPLLERFTSINYEHSLTPGELRGRSAKAYGTTRGEYAANGNLTIYLEDWKIMQAGLMAVPTPPGGFMEKRFQISVSYAEIGSAIVTDILRACRVVKAGKAYSRGTEALFVTLDLHIMEVLENGLPAVIDPGGQLLSV